MSMLAMASVMLHGLSMREWASVGIRTMPWLLAQQIGFVLTRHVKPTKANFVRWIRTELLNFDEYLKHGIRALHYVMFYVISLWRPFDGTFECPSQSAHRRRNYDAAKSTAQVLQVWVREVRAISNVMQVQSSHLTADISWCVRKVEQCLDHVNAYSRPNPKYITDGGLCDVPNCTMRRTHMHPIFAVMVCGMHAKQARDITKSYTYIESSVACDGNVRHADVRLCHNECQLCGNGGNIRVCDGCDCCVCTFCDIIFECSTPHNGNCFRCSHALPLRTDPEDLRVIHIVKGEPPTELCQRSIRRWAQLNPPLVELPSIGEDGIVVLSLFNGIGAALVALKQSNVKVKLFMFVEIDGKCNQHQLLKHPESIKLVTGPDGSSDVTQLSDDVISLELRRHGCKYVHLLIGGPPCNDFAAVNPKRMELKEGSSGLLVYEYIRIHKAVACINATAGAIGEHAFILENVASMSSHVRSKISEAIGRDPLDIDSSLHVAFRRRRLYWTNLLPPVMRANANCSLGDLMHTVHGGGVDGVMDHKGYCARTWCGAAVVSTVEAYSNRNSVTYVQDACNGTQWRLPSMVECCLGHHFPPDYLPDTCWGRQSLGRSFCPLTIQLLLRDLRERSSISSPRIRPLHVPSPPHTPFLHDLAFPFGSTIPS